MINTKVKSVLFGSQVQVSTFTVYDTKSTMKFNILSSGSIFMVSWPKKRRLIGLWQVSTF